MAFWNRRDREQAAPQDDAKSVVVSEELRTIIRDLGGWPHGGQYEMIYRRQPAVRTVVDFLARNIGQLRGKTYLRLDNSDREEIDQHPLAVLLRNPNPDTTRYRFFRDTVADIGIHDRAYWVKDRSPFPRALVRMPPNRLVRRIEGGVRVYRGPDGNVIPRERLVVFPGYCPEGAYWNEDGVSPLETLRRTLSEEWRAQRNREDMWRNAARQSGVIERPLDAPEWSDTARQRFRDDWENTMAGDGNGGRTGVLEEGMKWNAASFSPADVQYIEGRKLTFEEVCRVYGISSAIFQGEGTSKAIDSFHRQLYQDTLGPWLRMIQDEIELQLLPDVETSPATKDRTYFEFNLAEKLQGSFTEQATAITTAVGVPYMSVNEGRTLLNLPRVNAPEFDMPIQPLNVMYGGQPAVPVPTAVPQPKRHGKKSASAPRAALRRRDNASTAHEELFRRYFRAQEQAVAKVSKKSSQFDMDRWNSKLAGELYAARVTLARRTGILAAKQLGGVYDEKITLNYLQETARVQAEGINKHTAAALDAGDDPANVFEVAKTSRAVELGISTATTMINFARNEAAAQTGRAQPERRLVKTWVVTSANSRHPELDGETVGIGETFSNGATFPGDIGAGVDEVAGCQCLVDLS